MIGIEHYAANVSTREGAKLPPVTIYAARRTGRCGCGKRSDYLGIAADPYLAAARACSREAVVCEACMANGHPEASPVPDPPPAQTQIDAVPLRNTSPTASITPPPQAFTGGLW